MLVLLPLLTRWFFYLVYTMENNFSVYQHITPDGMYYFGQTNNIKRRWRNNGAEYKTTSLYPYIEKYGWNNIQHIVLFENQSKENALWIEDFLITTAQEDGVCINKQRSGLISKEEGYKQRQSKQYYETNKGQLQERHKQYREQNKDKIKQYYEQNKDKIKEQSKQYREQNKDKIKEQSKQYYEKNKDKIKEQSKQYYEKNKDKIREYQKQNKDKIREYNREYRQRKKEEKQFRELGYVPLF